MRLQEFWGVGPKTASTLSETIGEARAIEAIESADVGTLVDAGIRRGRAIRILRRARDDAGMEVLATSDTRQVYDDLLSLASSYALTDHASDRIRVLTPVTDESTRQERLDRVMSARRAWERLDEDDRSAVIDAFEAYDAAGGSDRAAVETAIELQAAGLDGETFDALEGLDRADLEDAAGALGYLDRSDGEVRVESGADEKLDRLREQLDAAASIENAAFDVIETVQERGARDLESFQHAVVEYVAEETGIDPARIRSVAADDPVDTADFVSTTLRGLVDDLESDVESRAETVIETLRSDIDDADEDVETAIEAVSEIAFDLSLGRFAAEHDLVRPEPIDAGIAVLGARSLFLDEAVQPIDYAVGADELDRETLGPGEEDRLPPERDRVTVLTGANSGGKTTLLETLCSIALLASIGLPVPAERAQVGWFDAIVFHRRHASFNAGVLESTLRSIVPPLSGEGRTLMLVDEFEAITEPGRAADLLNGLVDLTVDRDAVGVYVTHLADDLSPLPPEARIDGIFAEGLTRELELMVDYQPRFGTIGRSTPEFIVSRLVANASDPTERAGFEALARAIGEEAVQRTLDDARWSP